ncbi:hypothetical protein B1F79_00315 [Coxiella-like endosymbiont of Rhipicephalus sanguineus]|uniref:hypothetical protein n=1 Tax=Coxiella-like endosymbiont of Rhipicephalus sanguineus TaxID=1955402 RepID=UPI0020408FE4|nr:hypothetical protein [Coxiella-like endosymbiont of Rhipicephalus sanguineus]MBT8506230.1 hypothetical protein [Coxiella-like endosymbiont of Rhipicephalus sanguineus]
MNIGFILGFTLAGYYELKLNYPMFFILTAFNNIGALGVLLLQWKRLNDKDTIIFSKARTPRTVQLRCLTIGVVIILLLLPALHWLLRHMEISDDL